MNPNSPPEYASSAVSEPPSRRRKVLWAAGALAAVLALGFIVHLRLTHPAAGGNFRGAGRNALAVGVARVSSGDVPLTIDSLGTVTPLATVTVHPQVTGPLVKLDFTEGQMVKAGDVLAEIDPRPFQASLDQAQGQLQHDQASLANARVDLERYKTLLAQNSVAEQTFATQQATVLQDEATVITDRAAVETAQLNLGYCRILSPVSGSVGLRQVDIGNVVSAYSTEIVVVTQLQPMSVLFTVPEDNLSEVVKRLHSGEKLAVAAYDRTFTTLLDTGVLANTDNEIDTTTGTLKLRAMFNNSEGELFPSQFVNARLTLDTLHNQILVPGAAVQQGASGTYVYLVDAADPPGPPGAPGTPGASRCAGQRSGRARAICHHWAVYRQHDLGYATGYRSGRTVVVEGADQLRDGSFVTIQGASPAAADDNGAGAPAAGSPAARSFRGGSGSGNPRGKGQRNRRPPSQSSSPPGGAPL